MTPTAPPLSAAFRFALRDLRGSLKRFRVFLACLTLGVAAIAGVGSLSQALLTGLFAQGQAILGGDADFRLIHRPIGADAKAYLAQAGEVSDMISLRSMATDPRTDDRTLVQLKGVDGAYPLYGTVEIKKGGEDDIALALAKAGAEWGALIEPTLAVRLNLGTGDLVRINQLDYRIRGVIAYEPDRLGTGMAVGPRVLVHIDSLPETGLLQVGSLIYYHSRVALPPESDVGAFVATAKATFPDMGWRVQDRSNASPGLKEFLFRVGTFLTLVGLTALMVGGVGVANAITSYLDDKRDSIATLKCLGAPGGFIFTVYLTQVMVLAAVGVVIGLAIGVAIPFGAVEMVRAIVPVPADVGIYPAPLIIASLFGFLTAFLFAVLPLGRARDIPAAHLFRDLVAPDAIRPRPAILLMALGSLAVIAVIALVLSADWRFSLGFMVGGLVAFFVLRLFAIGIMRLAARLPRLTRPAWRMAVANLHRPGAATPAAVLSLGLGLTLVVTVALIEGNIDEQINQRVPDIAPSYFFIDVQQDQIGDFKTRLESIEGVEDLQFVPSLRGRIIRLNGQRIQDAKIHPDALWAVRGDRGLTYAPTLPPNSEIVAGDWWPEDYQGPPLVSYDYDLAQGMGLAVGDTITLNILGRQVEVTIANLRRVQWESMGLNFSFVFAPGFLEQAPHSWLGTLRADKTAEEAVYAMVGRDFPNVTMVRVKEAIAQANDLMESLALAVRLTGAMTILTGVLVLAGAMAAGHRRRVYDAVVMKVVGAQRNQIMTSYLAEYLMIGIAVAVLAGALGTLASYIVVGEVMQAPWIFLPSTLLLALLGSVAITLILGLFGTFRALGAKPAPVLRTQ